ncbi:hypothetical protein B0O99DRAFT_679511 [Bisporella sp. PMI_857]|nr:hypothetical protein B0O99DRAFT_679511 [Bisporella sp. PMI_857]
MAVAAPLGIGTALMNTIGIISGIAGTIQFGIDNFKEPERTGSSIKIAVGLDYKGGLQNSGGDLPDIRLWSENGEFLGMKADPGKVKNGNVGTVKVNHKKGNGAQATYALFSANNDAICIAYVSITWPDENKYAWLGDWGDKCGGSWFYSNIYVKGTNYSPHCFWIDKNGDQPQTGFQVHFPDFVDYDGKEIKAETKKGYCNSYKFKMTTKPDPNSIDYRPLGNAKLPRDSKGNPQLRKSQPAPAINKKPTIKGPQGNGTTGTGNKSLHYNRLIISDNPDHKVKDLCKSKASLGPDFANIKEGMFCRMKDKTLFPICNSKIKDKCFNVQSKQLIMGGKSARDIPYVDFGDWTSGGKKPSGDKKPAGDKKQ